MSRERSGIDALRDAIETVASDLETREAGRVAPSSRSVRSVAAWATTAAAIVIAAAGLWIARPAPTPEVEILEMKIRGRSVRAVVIENRAPGTLVIVPGEHRAERDLTTPIAGVAVLLGERR